MKLYLRFLRYIFRYPGILALGFCFMLIFALSSGFSIAMIYPIMDKIFLDVPATEQQQSLPLSEHGALLKQDISDLRAQGASLKEIKDTLSQRLAFFFDNTNKHTLLKVVVLVSLVLIFLKLVSGYMFKYHFVKIEQGVIKWLQDDVMRALMRHSLAFFSRHKTGDFIARVVSDINLLKNVAVANLAEFIKNAILAVAYLTIVFFLNIKLSLMVLVIFPPLMIVIRVINKLIRKYTHRAQRNIADITGTIGETINNIKVVLGFMQQKYELKKFYRGTQRYRDANIKLFRVMSLSNPLSEFIGTFIGLVVIFYGGSMVLDQPDTFTPGKFFLFLGAILSLVHPLNRMAKIVGQFQNGVVALMRIFYVIDSEIDIREDSQAEELQALEQRIEVKNVSFAYENEDWVLQDINLTLNKGERVAIVGPSGCGKSTLVDLMMRFYDVNKGEILIDGRNIKTYSLASLRTLFGMVSQDVMLFNTSIQDNITYGETFTPDQVQQAASLANCDPFIGRLKEGLDAQVGEKGTKLSGGEKQRIAIARAIIRRPHVYIFDEATSSLDNESEYAITEAFFKASRDRTAIVIAHRLSTIKDVDRIIVMDQGRIIAQGDHDTLYKDCQVYRNFYDLQFRNGT